MTVLGLQWYSAFACLLCQSPCSPSLQVHAYISNHQYVTASHIPWVSLFQLFPQRPIFQEVWVFFWGGDLCRIIPRIGFSAFSNPLFSPTQPIIFLN